MYVSFILFRSLHQILKKLMFNLTHQLLIKVLCIFQIDTVSTSTLWLLLKLNNSFSPSAVNENKDKNTKHNKTDQIQVNTVATLLFPSSTFKSHDFTL